MLRFLAAVLGNVTIEFTSDTYAFQPDSIAFPPKAIEGGVIAHDVMQPSHEPDEVI
jgi:hypothetical protein